MFKNLPKSKLAKHTARLNLISTGSGSVVVSNEVSGIELIFKKLNSAGHAGPRKFWRDNLPRVQFYNPELPIQVKRIEPDANNDFKDIPAFLRVHLKDGTVQTADIKNKHSDEILKEFIKLTNATPAQEITHSLNSD